MIFIFLPSIIYSQYLGSRDVDIFINGYAQIKNILDEHRDDEENGDWVKYNGLTDAFQTMSEEYIKKSTNNEMFNDVKRRYQEMLACKAPWELESVFRTIGWKIDGNKKFLTLTLGWGFLYGVKELEKETSKIPKVMYKLFVEKYYLGMLNLLKLFNEHDLDIINVHMEEIKYLMM
jgi:hypothetical protein